MAKKKEEQLVEMEELQNAEFLDEFEVPTNENDEELLFPDGPLMSKVDEWKSRYTDIYFTEFDREVFIWRCMTRQEYKEIMNIQGADTYYREERICERCIIWPEKYNFTDMKTGKAGIPTFLGEQIMEKSGFSAKMAALKL